MYKTFYSDWVRLPSEAPQSIFLAGPTPRGASPESWRPKAVSTLREKLQFEGAIFVPEPREGPTGLWLAPDEQMLWEHRALDLATCIAFWVPRSMKDMPALTTNVEFGLYARSNKVVLGYPKNAEKMDYIKFCAIRFGISIWGELEDTLFAATVMARAGR